jgi:hypothetical protein
MDQALIDVRGTLFQAMSIVRMAARAAEDDPDADVDVWVSLDAAHEILSRVADRLQDSESLLADEVLPHGEY